MALTKEEQAIIDNFNRAKAQQDAQREIALKEAAERLALQQSQTDQLEAQAKQAARQQATQTYVAGQQAGRVLPNQMAQSGLAMSGYRSLAQQKMAREQTVGQQGIRANLGNQMSGYARNREADQLNYAQNVRSTQNAYNQNVANLKLDKQQALDRQTEQVLQQQQVQQNFNVLLQTAMAGGMSYEQFKLALSQYYTVGSTEYQAYLQRYLQAERNRNLTPPINYTTPISTTTPTTQTTKPTTNTGGRMINTTAKY